MFKKRKAPVSNPLPEALQAQAASFPGIGATLPPNGLYGSRTMNRPVAASGVRSNNRPKKGGFKVWAKRFFLMIMALVLISVGFVGTKVLINAGKSFTGSLFGLLQNDKLRGESQGRVNILLAGNSADDVGHGGAQLTDSIMILSIDTKDHKAFMLSVPRDLYVDIPGHGYAKINEAYVDGQNDHFSQSGYPDGGMGLLSKVVSEDFGIDLQYYALIDYSAFKQAVDAVGGIDVNIQSSDPRGLYDPSRDWTSKKYQPLVKLSNGVHHLNGQEALNLARARGDTYGAYGYAQSDFTRTSNQRLMLLALKDKATSAGVALNPIKIASLLDSFGNNVTTDFKTSEVRRLYDISKQIPSNQITSAGLNDVNGKSLLKSYTTRSGQSALIPATGVNDYTAIQTYVARLTAGGSIGSASSDTSGASQSQ